MGLKYIQVVTSLSSAISCRLQSNACLFKWYTLRFSRSKFVYCLQEEGITSFVMWAALEDLTPPRFPNHLPSTSSNVLYFYNLFPSCPLFHLSFTVSIVLHGLLGLSSIYTYCTTLWVAHFLKQWKEINNTIHYSCTKLFINIQNYYIYNDSTVPFSSVLSIRRKYPPAVPPLETWVTKVATEETLASIHKQHKRHFAAIVFNIQWVRYWLQYLISRWTCAIVQTNICTYNNEITVRVRFASSLFL